MVVEPGGSTRFGIVVVVVVVGWTIVGTVVLVVARTMTGDVVDETMAANPRSSSQSPASLPSSHDGDDGTPAAACAGVTTTNAETKQHTRTQ